MSQYAFLNNEFLPEEKAMIHVRDLSVQRGYGIFDFFKVIAGKPLYLENHLDRFYSSAEKMYLQVSYSREELEKIIGELLEKNDSEHCGIRITLTGGYSSDGYSISHPLLIITLHNFSSPSQAQYHQGISLACYEHQRQLPEIKTIDYLMAIWLQPWLKKMQADDVLYHHQGWISECPRSNFFLITEENKLVTPAKNILKGITRMKILEAARSIFEVEERPVHLHELTTAKEAFISSSTKKILPVSRIDSKAFPVPGARAIILTDLLSQNQTGTSLLLK
ncbi:MAG: aminotransferase class IV [Flavisolibacter sp.]